MTLTLNKREISALDASFIALFADLMRSGKHELARSLLKDQQREGRVSARTMRRARAMLGSR